MRYLPLAAFGLCSCSLLVTLLKPNFQTDFKCNNGRVDVGELCLEPTFDDVIGSPSRLNLGDVNGDGRLDIVTIDTNFGELAWMQNQGDGTFTKFTQQSGGNQPFAVATGRLDGNDALDDLAIVFQNSLQVLRAEGSSFTLTDSLSSIGGPFDVVVGELNNIAGDDVAVVNSQGDSLSFFNGTNDGQQLVAPVDLAAGDFPESVAAGDLDGDQDLDLVVAASTSNTVTILINDGAVPTVGGSFATGTSPRDVALADLNNDGRLDIVTINTDDLSVLLQQANGNFGAPTSVASGNTPLSITAGDFDGDGLQDLAVANFGEQQNDVSIYLNHSDGTLGVPINLTTEDGAIDVAAGDLNDDGVDDLAIIHADGKLVVLFSNP